MTLGLDLGGTQIKAVLLSDTGEILRRELRPTTADFPATIRALVEELAPTSPVGISAPGLAAPDGRSIAHMPARMPGLAGLDWTTHLAREKVVPVLNDAHAALLGEAWIGAARGLRDCFMLTLGTGVGGAILADGRILRGHLGRAGHLGHLSLDPFGLPDIVRTPGSLEDAIGNHNIAQRTAGRFATTHDLIAAATAGDQFAGEIWRRSIRALAAAIASLINILDPEAVILGGGIAQAGDSLFAPLRDELDQLEWRPTATPVKLLPAQLGEWAGAIGAAHEARRGFLEPRLI
jgi:glucokinase